MTRQDRGLPMDGAGAAYPRRKIIDDVRKLVK